MYIKKLFVFSNDSKNLNVVSYGLDNTKTFYKTSTEGLDKLDSFISNGTIKTIKITDYDQAVIYMNDDRVIMINKLSNVLIATQNSIFAKKYYNYFANLTKSKLKECSEILVDFAKENKEIVIAGSLAIASITTGCGLALAYANDNKEERLNSVVIEEQVSTIPSQENFTKENDTEVYTYESKAQKETTTTTKPTTQTEVQTETTTIKEETETTTTEETTTQVNNEEISKDGHITYIGGEYFYNNHRETYYEEEVLPGPGLDIPGRHVADDGTIRDIDNYICVATDFNYLPYGTILETSLGTAKVYDTGCPYGTVDIYVNGQRFSAYCKSESKNR